MSKLAVNIYQHDVFKFSLPQTKRTCDLALHTFSQSIKHAKETVIGITISPILNT